MLGVIAAMVWYGVSRKKPFWEVADFVAPCVPTGLAAGRVGNFMNGELWGRLADPALPWGMVFRGAGDLPRHPSQVYQFLLEESAAACRIVVVRAHGSQARSGCFRVSLWIWSHALYCRVFPRYAHLGLLSLGMSMGQWLCLPMIAGGMVLWWWFQQSRVQG